MVIKKTSLCVFSGTIHILKHSTTCCSGNILLNLFTKSIIIFFCKINCPYLAWISHFKNEVDMSGKKF